MLGLGELEREKKVRVRAERSRLEVRETNKERVKCSSNILGYRYKDGIT